jgi:hypothetical protein
VCEHLDDVVARIKPPLNFHLDSFETYMIGTWAFAPQIVSALAIPVIAPSRLTPSPGGCPEMNAIVATAARILKGSL